MTPFSDKKSIPGNKSSLRFPAAGILVTSLVTSSIFVPSIVIAEEKGREHRNSQPAIEEITVTSRRREESLQDVPDSITAFSASAIKSAGIDHVSDFVQLTPNITLREAFRAGVTFITMRGITTGQQGWAPVSFVVDGVPVASLDAINQGALVEIERIEVLKGPQGALYGAGAIAGAINVITRKPGNEFEGGGKLSYAKGNDFKGSFSVSGSIKEDKVLYRLDVYHRDTDGLIDSTDDTDLDFETQSDVRGRLVFDSGDVSVDVRGHYGDVEAGAAMQELLPTGATGLDLLDDFDHSPGIARGIIGVEDRSFAEASVKIEWETDIGTITSVSGYSDIKQNLFGTVSWNRPPALSFCGPVGGIGEAPDCFQRLGDDIEAFTQDLRISSSSDQSVRWMAGLSYLRREAVNLLRVGEAAITPNGKVGPGINPFLNSVFERNDRFFGIYGQANIDISNQIELTLAGRWDENKFDATQYETRERNTPVPVLTPDGLVTTQGEVDSEFQPKAQLSYAWTDDIMTYVTVAKGFRTGFFNTGNLTEPETTWNYEFGFKTTLMDRRVRANGSIFYIDYSNQQFSRIVPPPKIRETDNIPETRIKGLELEVVAAPIENLSVSFGLGYLDAEVADGTDSPFTPDYTLNLGLEYSHPLLNSEWDAIYRVDYRRQASQFLERNNRFEIEEKDYLNMRLSFENEKLRITAFADNILNSRQPNEINEFPFGFIRVVNKPRSYGIEAAFRF